MGQLMDAVDRFIQLPGQRADGKNFISPQVAALALVHVGDGIIHTAHRTIVVNPAYVQIFTAYVQKGFGLFLIPDVRQGLPLAVFQYQQPCFNNPDMFIRPAEIGWIIKIFDDDRALRKLKYIGSMITYCCTGRKIYETFLKSIIAEQRSVELVIKYPLSGLKIF